MIKPLPKAIREHIFIAGLILLALGIIYSCPVMSMSIMLLGANWIAEMDYTARLRRFIRNKTAVLLSSVFFIHAIGLLWSSDLSYGWDDVRTKIPLFVLPFILSTSSPLSKEKFQMLIGFFISGIFLNSLISMAILKGLLRIPTEIHDIRDISIFVSHIRLSLMICFSIFVLIYYGLRTNSILFRILSAALILWFIIFLGILESLTGLFILAVVVIVLSLVFLRSRKPTLARILSLSVFVSLAAGIFWIYSIAKPFLHLKPMKESGMVLKTPGGMPYTQDTTSPYVENGYYIWLNVCWPELEVGWAKRSHIPMSGKDANGNPISQTLLRYLTSKGFVEKDLRAVAALTDEDVSNIEKGITNYKFTNLSSLQARIYETIWELDVYRKGGYPNGHSTTMRFEFWKTGWHIFKNNFLAGVGTGDVKNAFHDQYEQDNTTLEPYQRLRAHDQFITIGIALGIPGLILFLVSLFYPLFHARMYRNYFYLVFWLILFISMFSEDTLETQAGVTFFALFNSLLLFCLPKGEGEWAGGETSETGIAH